MVAGQGKLRALLLNREIVELGLARKLVAEAQAIIKHAEPYPDGAAGSGLRERHGQLVVVVANGFHLAPHRLPAFIEGALLAIGHGKAAGERRGIFQLQPQLAGFDNVSPLVGEVVSGYAIVLQRELQRELPVGRLDSLGVGVVPK